MIIELNDRKKKILEALISKYVETAEPVGSVSLTHSYFRQFSPATLRAEMAELERSGYLTHPHTSAGRTPTDLGYRYYVDHIMETKKISGREIALIKSGIKKIGRGVEEIFHGTAKILSSLLNYVAVFVPFGHRTIPVYKAGLSQTLRQPEFSDIDIARQFVETIEQEEFLARLLAEYAQKQKLNIHIGHENHYRRTRDLSVVVAQCRRSGLNPGVIGIIGPTRMDYDHVASLLNFVSDELETI